MARPLPQPVTPELPLYMNFTDPFIKEVFCAMVQTGSQGLLEESQNLRRQLIDYLSTPEQEAIHEELR
jgi:hypothetical protein